MKRTADNGVLELIAERRLARNWSVAYLAKKTGISASTIKSWYSKGTMPTMSTLLPVIRALDIPITDVVDSGERPVNVTTEDRALLYKWSLLSEKQRGVLMESIDSYIELNLSSR